MKKLTFALFLILSSQSFAAPKNTVRATIHDSINHRESFSALPAKIAGQHGLNAVSELQAIALDEKESDEARWVALFTLSKLTGRNASTVIKKLMNAKSWMLRDAAVKNAAALGAIELREDVESKLSDPALIVRTSAVDALNALNSTASAPKLIRALDDMKNFAGKKPLWIHDHILDTLVKFDYKPAIPALVDFMEKTKGDVKMLPKTLQALQSLTGKNFASKSTTEQMYLYKKAAVEYRNF